jgi:peptidoglycan/LPS O-acetylase OafA/YrhL
MSDWTHRLAPDVVAWFSQDARLAVQVFLVVAGFLAARSLAPQGVLKSSQPLWMVRQRYIRIGLPLMAALLVAIVCTEIAREWMAHDSLPDFPDFWQVVTHALLVHSLLDVDSLSAGVWYVAVDMQLFTVLLAILWLNNKLKLSVRAVMICVAGLVMASLLHFNRDSDWDNWAVYFFGAYGLGALTHWLSSNVTQTSRWIPMGLLAAVTVVALAIDFRTRIALALAVSLLLFWAQTRGWLFTWPNSKTLNYLSKISYSVFLLNFPVALVVNAWFTRFASADAWVQTVGVLVAWVACNVAGALFYAVVEKRTHRWARSRPIPGAVPAGA